MVELSQNGWMDAPAPTRARVADGQDQLSGSDRAYHAYHTYHASLRTSSLCLQYRIVASDFEEHLGHGVYE